MPDLLYFCPKAHSDKVRQELINWHNEMRDKGMVFNFREEIYKYSAQDVTILRLCRMKFRELFINETKNEISVVYVLRRQSRDKIRDIKRSVYCQYTTDSIV